MKSSGIKEPQTSSDDDLGKQSLHCTEPFECHVLYYHSMLNLEFDVVYTSLEDRAVDIFEWTQSQDRFLSKWFAEGVAQGKEPGSA